MSNLLENIKTNPRGHLRIYEKETGKVLLDQHNDINPENFSYALATSLVGQKSGNIRYMVFGNGGARATSSNKYIYSVPQTVGKAASLYRQTYKKDLSTPDEDNYMNVSHASGNDYSDIIVHCTLKKDEVYGVLGNTADSDSNAYGSVGNNGSIVTDQTFSEIGLVTDGEDLITHICFFPIEKTSQSTIIIEYILRIQIV